ncbi:MAG: transferase [Peptococcaceae bacterium BRH_c4b]|nr:MAG: transferase [Peptococcaceae bacterium BRH_c4b]
MLEYSPVTSWHDTEKYPVVSPSAFIHETAILIGNIIIEDDVIIHPGAIIRADEGSPITIGKGTNVQDGVIMHCLLGSSIDIGSNCSIAHGAVIHGPCRVGDNCFIGFNAVLLKAELGSGSFVSHCALVTEVSVGDNKYVPPSAIIDMPTKALHLVNTTNSHFEFSRDVLGANEELRNGYRLQERTDMKHVFSIVHNTGNTYTHSKKSGTG